MFSRFLNVLYRVTVAYLKILGLVMFQYSEFFSFQKGNTEAYTLYKINTLVGFGIEPRIKCSTLYSKYIIIKDYIQSHDLGSGSATIEIAINLREMLGVL